MKQAIDTKSFSFKKLTNQDLSLLQRWFQEPHVQRWWPIKNLEEHIKTFIHRIESNNTIGYIVSMHNIPIGYIQYYYINRTNKDSGSWLPKISDNTIGTDQFIGEVDYLHKGYGTIFIKLFLNHIKSIEPIVTTIIVDPDPTNYAAIRCYEKVGFKNIGTYNAPWGKVVIMRYDFVE